jgi:hypothetical protein
MAFQQTIIHDIRLVGPVSFSAYIRVSNVAGNKEGMTAEAQFLVDGPQGELIKVVNFSFDLDLKGENPIKQAYHYLKTLPEFSDAEDC